ncbi:hypothetical protein [Pararcticibacter amylolyticus]|uniref:Lipoprotein n=1 Tax=Pararcticibacter amylolyticus TaxID=2173175 RepID=A0A2U2PA68_9SPHI|nr:hypothetical protein [Pararcticibacter amylolyticus]PWG78245.1 hypothetical protein DDR33_23335 [Pararcticibacter amylolyticus]
MNVKFLIVSVLIACLLVSCVQSKLFDGCIREKKIEGYIFPKEYRSSLVHFDDVKERYTPIKEDVLRVEQLIKEQLVFINKPLINQGGNCPVIHKNLSKYARQYIGYFDQNNDKIIWVNFFIRREKDQLSKLNKDLIFVLDGCSNYWNVKVNLNKGKLYDLRINGSS